MAGRKDAVLAFSREASAFGKEYQDCPLRPRPTLAAKKAVKAAMRIMKKCLYIYLLDHNVSRFLTILA
jgi:hypothetical protein